LCDYGGVWHQPNVSTCVTREFINIKNKVIHEINVYNFCICSFQSDSLNATDAANVTDIITELVNITKPNNQSQLPQDISVAVEVLETIINRCELLCQVPVDCSVYRLNTTNQRKIKNSGDVVDVVDVC